MRKKLKPIIISVSLFSLFTTSSILFFVKKDNQVIQLKETNLETNSFLTIEDKYKEIYNRLLVGIRKYEIIDLSDLEVSENDVKKVYASIMNNLTPLFPYLSPPQKDAPRNFFVKDKTTQKWNGQVDARPREHLLNEHIKKSQQMFEKMLQIMKFIPWNNDESSYIYWMYSFISNWISYNKQITDSQLFVTALLSRKGICESYSKMSQFFFNVFGIEAVYQTGILKSGQAAGPHIWNKYKLGNDWFNFDTTSASTAETGYYLKPVGDYLAFRDSDFPTKREQYPTWYESSVNANVDISSIQSYVPFDNNLKTKKWVYKDKWYYLNHQTMEIIESDIDKQNKKVIRQINRSFDDKYISSFLTIMVGNELFWIDKYESESLTLTKYNIDTEKIENVIVFDKGLDIHSFSLSDINEISITTYNEVQGTKTRKETIKSNYNFFDFQPNKITQKALASLMSLYFMEFEVGYNKGQLLERNYLKYTDILTKAFYEKNFNQELFNKLKTFKEDVLKDINKENIFHIDPVIANSVNVDLYENLFIESKIKYENVELNQLSFKWFISSDKNNWTLIEDQNEKDLKINNIGKTYKNMFVKMEIHYQESISQSNACFLNINENIQYPQIKLSFDKNNSNEFNINDQIKFNITSSGKDLVSDRFNLYKKSNQNKELVIKNQTIENIFYSIKKEDLFQNLEFIITNQYFDDNLESQPISIKINPKITFSINNNENVTSIENVKLNQEIEFHIKTPDPSLIKFNWKYNNNNFMKISNTDDLSKIKLKVINVDNINQTKIECDISQINSPTIYKKIEFNLFFSNNDNGNNDNNNNDVVDPENPNQNSANNNQWLYILLGILIPIILLIVIIISIVIIKKKKVNK